jgi:hypothetical protein
MQRETKELLYLLLELTKSVSNISVKMQSYHRKHLLTADKEKTLSALLSDLISLFD